VGPYDLVGGWLPVVLRNTHTHMQDHMASQPTRSESTFPPLLELQVSHVYLLFHILGTMKQQILDIHHASYLLQCMECICLLHSRAELMSCPSYRHVMCVSVRVYRYM
jgi:hypothetical protein